MTPRTFLTFVMVQPCHVMPPGEQVGDEEGAKEVNRARLRARLAKKTAGQRGGPRKQAPNGKAKSKK